jgi:thiosulfate/3-mercaptopyruvate sulfurtransferase
MSEYAHPDVLVTTEWLESNLDGDDIAIVEVDEDTTAYAKGHIPGAISINWEAELHDLPRREFVSSAKLAELLGSKGIGDSHTIVLYSGNNNWFATYAYWLFKYRGIDNVKLLDGGRKKWELESRLLSQDEPRRAKTSLSVGSERPELRIFRDEVTKRVESGGAWVDVRSPEEFRCWRRRTFRRSRPRFRVTSPARPTSPGPRQSRTTAPSSPPTSSRPFTRPRALPPTRTWWPTAV